MSDLEQVPVEALWILAIVSSVALAAAFLTMPGTGRRRETALRAAVAVLMPLVGLVYVFGRVARQAQVHNSGDDPEATALFLFSVVALAIAAQRVIFARYIKRWARLARSGNAVQTATGKQVTVFLLTLFVVLAAVGVSLAVGLSSIAPIVLG